MNTDSQPRDKHFLRLLVAHEILHRPADYPSARVEWARRVMDQNEAELRERGERMAAK